jgi:hypothetical protein
MAPLRQQPNRPYTASKPRWAGRIRLGVYFHRHPFPGMFYRWANKKYSLEKQISRFQQLVSTGTWKGKVEKAILFDCPGEGRDGTPILEFTDGRWHQPRKK